MSTAANGSRADDAYGNITIESSSNTLTLFGNVGASNTTGNFTLEAHSRLILADNMTTFKASSLTLGTNSTLTTGNNASTGNNRADADALTITSNITMRGSSTLNIGENTSINGTIKGDSAGQGTLNINGNFTSGGLIGGTHSAPSGLAQVNISAGNTLTIGNSHNVTATNMDINGTVTAAGNITSTVTLGSGAVLNLDSGGDDAPNAAGVVDGIIDGSGGTTAYGTLNINGTYTTRGVIGGAGGTTGGLSAINLDVDNNATSLQGNTVTFAHSVNATTITLGTSTSSKNATLLLSANGGGSTGNNLVITGNIAGGGNYTAGKNIASGILDIDTETVVDGTIGTSGAYLADIKIGQYMILTAKGSIYSGNITFEGGTDTPNGSNATLALNGTSGTAYDVKGRIYSSIDNPGTGLIDVNSGNWTFDSEIGGSTNRIGGMRIEEDAWSNLSNNVYANETVTIEGVLNVTGSLSITAMDISGNGKGLVVGEGVSTRTTNATIQISSDSILTIGSTNKSSGVHEGDGASFNNMTIRLKGAGTTSYNSNSTAAIDIGSSNQTVTLSQVSIDMLGDNSTYSDGQVVNIIGRGSTAGNNGTLSVTQSVSVIDGSAMLSYSNNARDFITGSGSNNQTAASALQVTVNYVSGGTLGLTGNTLNTYNGAKTAIGRDDAVFRELSRMTTNAQVDAAIATLHPATGGAAAASASISGTSMATAGTRMAYTRQTSLGKGMNAGAATLDESMWLQIFGASVDQDTVDSVTGYDADGQGLAIGIDGLSADGTTRIGIAGSFAQTDVSGKDSTTKTTTDIDTTQVMFYANKDYADGMYVEGVASLSFNDNTGTRRLLVGAVDRTASSSYDSNTFALKVEAGWPTERDGVTITPTLGFAYTQLSADAYTETGAGTLNLTVTPADVTTMEGKLGVKITGKTVNADGGVGRPEFRLGVSTNFGDDTADSTSTFTSGGASFTTTGVKTDGTKVDVGVGYTYTTPEGDTEISVNADGRNSDSYIQYGGGLTVKWKF